MTLTISSFVTYRWIGEVETLPKANKDDIEAIKIADDFEANGLSYTRDGMGEAIPLYTGTSALLPQGI
jgi:hypothetical protein